LSNMILYVSGDIIAGICGTIFSYDVSFLWANFANVTW
jgi:hypothetical protein